MQFRTASSSRPAPTSCPSCCAGRVAPGLPCGRRWRRCSLRPASIRRLARLDLTAAEIRLPYSVARSVRRRATSAMRRTWPLAHTFQGLGLKPLSPVHVRSVRSAATSPSHGSGARASAATAGRRPRCRSARIRSATRSTSSTARTWCARSRAPRRRSPTRRPSRSDRLRRRASLPTTFGVVPALRRLRSRHVPRPAHVV